MSLFEVFFCCIFAFLGFLAAFLFSLLIFACRLLLLLPPRLPYFFAPRYVHSIRFFRHFFPFIFAFFGFFSLYFRFFGSFFVVFESSLLIFLCRIGIQLSSISLHFFHQGMLTNFAFSAFCFIFFPFFCSFSVVFERS